MERILAAVGAAAISRKAGTLRKKKTQQSAESKAQKLDVGYSRHVILPAKLPGVVEHRARMGEVHSV